MWSIIMFSYQLKMLVLLILVTNTLHICEGKALLEETESNRGKRSYGYLPSTGLHQTYDPQSNAEHWMKGGFYEPQVDGQPIYVPAVDQPGSYQEFLDAYYKAYTPSWNVDNPSSYVYASKSASDIKGSSEYAVPIPKEFSADTSSSDLQLSESEDYGDPEVVDSVSTTLFINENLDELENVEEPLKKPNVPKTKSKDDQYIPPITKVSQKQKTKDKTLNKPSFPKNVYKNSETVKDVKQKPKVDNSKKESPKLSTPKNTYKPNKKTVQNPNKDGVKSPLSKETESLLEMSKFSDGLEMDGTPVTELNEENLDDTSEMSDDEFEEPIIRGSLKSESKNKPKDDQYDMPVVVKTVKQKPKATNAKKDRQKKPSTPVNSYKTTKNTKDSDETTAVYKPQLSKEKEFSVETSMAEDYDLDSEDYDNPEIVEAKKEFENEVETSELADRFEVDLNKPQSELSNTKDYNQYDMPVVIKKQKKTTNKKRINNQKRKPQLQSSYAKPTRKSIKAKPAEKASTPKYGVQTSQGTRKVQKGKRRKQYSKPYSRTGEMEKEISEATEMSKKDVQPYPPEDYQNKAQEKTKEKVITKQNSQYKSAKPKIKQTNSRPIAIKEKKPVNSDSEYLPVKTKEKETTKQISQDKPVKEITYDTELGRELTNSDENVLSEGDTSTTDPEKEPNLGSSDMSQSESSENLNSESKTTETNKISEGANGNTATNPESTVSHANDFRGLSSMNSNIWSMLFNPNAEQNRLKLKKCITRSNETGFCTYIQNCEVPHIATSLEQLLNNACVIDDIFIGVCCPEFPVQTVKVNWDQTPDIDNHIEDEFGHIAEDCGIRSNEASELQSWPWKAPLVSMSNGKIFCGGVIVSEDHVLTAAHCTTKIPKNQILVRLGQYDDESGDDYAVVEIKRHAQYNPRTMQNDVALLKLGRRIMNDAHIGIVCLPDEDHENDHDGEVATLLGWRGIFGTKSRDPEFLRVISNKECENKLGMKVPNTSLCTETRKESERTCNADSGAPLVIEDDGKYEVIGILSWNRNDCDQRFPSQFSRVSSYAGWIKNHIG